MEMSFVAIGLLQRKPLAPKIPSRYAGMWSAVEAVHRTTLYRVRKKSAGNAVLIALATIGAAPLIASTCRKPVWLQPNRFWPAFGLAPHAAEW